MTAPDAAHPAECVALSEAEARRITDEIRHAAERIWELLLVAYEREAWRALGYPNWRDWAQQEFGWGQSRVYQLLDQAKVIRALEEATISTKVEITEREARDIKPHLPEVIDRIKRETNGHTPERAAQIVAEVIDEERERLRTETHERLIQLPPDLHRRVVKGQYDLSEAEMAHKEGEARLDIWADNLREAMRRLARMAGAPIPPGIHARLDDDELAVLTTILNALGEGNYGFLE